MYFEEVLFVNKKKVCLFTSTGTSNSSSKRFTAVSTVTWIRIPATEKLTFRHR